MSDNLLSDDPADRVFIASTAREFQGQPLKPFSIGRQYAAQAMGNKLLCGGARLEQRPCEPCAGPQCPRCDGTGRILGSYPGMLVDVATLIWLCLVEPTEAAQASDNPTAARAKVLAWAETRGLGIGTEALREASVLYWTLLDELNAAQFKTPPETEGGNV